MDFYQRKETDERHEVTMHGNLWWIEHIKKNTKIIIKRWWMCLDKENNWIFWFEHFQIDWLYHGNKLAIAITNTKIFNTLY